MDQRVKNSTMTCWSSVLIVDDVPENLSMLHDALDEAGHEVRVATYGEAALLSVKKCLPDVILLDAVMPGMDGFEVCRRLREDEGTHAVPVIFMTGLCEAEHILAGFAAGGTDYITKPVRPSEVLARIAVHVNQAKHVKQAHTALDAFGQAVFAIEIATGKVGWQTPLARQLMHTHLFQHEQVITWLKRVVELHQQGREVYSLKLSHGEQQLVLSLSSQTADGEWLVTVREESTPRSFELIMRELHLTPREAEVLYWVIHGKTNRDIGDILGGSPRTVNKHLEHIFAKLHVETRTAAASVAMAKLGINRL